ncbi:MAG: MarR family transcriptional regulator [Actinobacteria bacterium]|nr:MarR family transcriptional regulator [Actinomycetota bacterium]
MDALEHLIDEIRLTFHSLSEVAKHVNDHDIDPSARAVLEFLSIHGPTTVPDIARRRGVSRQHIQTIVNGLVDRGFVVLQPNPAHSRSHRIALTTDGTAVIGAVLERERSLLAPFNNCHKPTTIASTATTIASLRKFLDQIQEPT